MSRSWAIFILISCFAFLYLPLLYLIIFSFNEGKFITNWAGFSFKWYEQLFNNQDLFAALLTSLKIAFTSATLASIIGISGAVSLTKFPYFKGKTFFKGMATAPLVMPEIIIGLALLLLFVSLEQMIGWPQGRGVMTIMIAHTTITTAYVIAVVQSRLFGMDPSLEEAALDLGATPFKAFMQVTFPIIFPAVAVGWLLAFMISFDDVVIASFVSGPGATTLPMKIFSSLKFGISPELNALATVMILSIVILFFLCLNIYRKKSK